MGLWHHLAVYGATTCTPHKIVDCHTQRWCMHKTADIRGCSLLEDEGSCLVNSQATREWAGTNGRDGWFTSRLDHRPFTSRQQSSKRICCLTGIWLGPPYESAWDGWMDSQSLYLFTSEHERQQLILIDNPLRETSCRSLASDSWWQRRWILLIITCILKANPRLVVSSDAFYVPRLVVYAADSADLIMSAL